MENFNKFEIKASQVNRIVNKIKEDSYRILDRNYDTPSLKAALEKIAQDSGGNLALLPDLEENYFNILLDELKIKLEQGEFSDFSDLSSLMKILNKKKILDDKKIGKLLDLLKSEVF